jgi:hypothetical protein
MTCSGGWVELMTPGARGRRGQPPRDASLHAAGQLVAGAQALGSIIVLGESDGRWHVWIRTRPCEGTTSLLPLFKALGSVAHDSCGVLDLVDASGTAVRWVMTHGSVDLAFQPYPVQG